MEPSTSTPDFKVLGRCGFSCSHCREDLQLIEALGASPGTAGPRAAGPSQFDNPDTHPNTVFFISGMEPCFSRCLARIAANRSRDGMTSSARLPAAPTAGPRSRCSGPRRARTRPLSLTRPRPAAVTISGLGAGRPSRRRSRLLRPRRHLMAGDPVRPSQSPPGRPRVRPRKLPSPPPPTPTSADSGPSSERLLARLFFTPCSGRSPRSVASRPTSGGSSSVPPRWRQAAGCRSWKCFFSAGPVECSSRSGSRSAVSSGACSTTCFLPNSALRSTWPTWTASSPTSARSPRRPLPRHPLPPRPRAFPRPEKRARHRHDALEPE